jgi:hypothetical protein
MGWAGNGCCHHEGISVNPGISEEAGKAAHSLIDGLKQSPATLSLTIVLLGLLVWMFYALHEAAELRTNLITQQNEYQKHVTEILSKCIVPRGD